MRWLRPGDALALRTPDRPGRSARDVITLVSAPWQREMYSQSLSDNIAVGPLAAAKEPVADAIGVGEDD